eukprot:c8305_g1_i1 orf=363-2009(+)
MALSESLHRSAGVADDAWYEIGLSNVAATKSSSVGVFSASGACSEHGTIAASMSPSRSVFLELPPALIAEIFKHLDARELSVVSCVCSLFRGLSSDSHGWKNFYCERWGNPVPNTFRDASSEKTWRDLYVAREARSKAFLGRFRTDMMNGHSKAVRCVRVLSPANLIFTAGYDSILRIWDLEECLPVTWSRPLGYTLRAIAVDMRMLVVGGTDANIRVWKAFPGLSHIFDVGGVPGASEIVLPGHNGPITSLSMDDTRICSGSWDMTVKVWDRTSMACIRTLIHGDWVWAVTLRSQRLVTTAGSDVYSWDIEAGRCLRVLAGAHSGQAYAVECSKSGHFLFSGGEDGIIRMYEDKSLRKKGSARYGDLSERSSSELVAYWQPHSGAVYALAFEDPWLVSASGDGSLAMMDIRKITKRSSDRGKLGRGCGKAKFHRAPWAMVSTDVEPPQRMLFGSHQCFYSVDIGADRIVSAGEEQVVKVWDFSHALEIERRVQASRTVRLEQRLKRKQGAHQHQDKQRNNVCSSIAKRDAVIEGAVVWQRRGIKIKA